LLIDTGLRRSELCDLRVQDVDLIAGEATIWHGKFDRKRIVAFQSKASAALDRYMRLRGQHPDHELPNLWLGRAGPLTHTTIYRIVKERAAKAGIGHVWTHLFRHTAAHAWLAAGGSELGLMEIAGWRDRKMLSKYGAELKSERARDEARRLDLGDRL
jgi:integrase